MKRITRTKKAVVALAACSAFVLAACGEAPEEATPAETPEAVEETVAAETAAEEAAAEPTYSGCLVADTGDVTDKGFNQSAWEGMQAAAAANPAIDVKYVTATSQNDYAPAIDAFIAADCDIIVTVGFLMGDATRAAAEANPGQQFAIVDVAYEAPISNLTSMVYDVGQGAFLGGFLAAGWKPEGAFGMSGGIKIPPVTLYLDGLAGGVEYYNQENGTSVGVLGWDPATQEGTFVGDFTDQAKAQSIAQALLDQGATVLIGGGGALTPATAQTIQQSDSGAAMLWLDVDGCVSAPEYCDVILGSVLKGVGPSITDILLQGAAGTQLPTTYLGTLENGGVDFIISDGYRDQISAELTAQLDAVRQGIIDGTVTVTSPSTPVA